MVRGLNWGNPAVRHPASLQPYFVRWGSAALCALPISFGLASGCSEMTGARAGDFPRAAPHGAAGSIYLASQAEADASLARFDRDHRP